jgi:hypothetical protein
MGMLLIVLVLAVWWIVIREEVKLRRGVVWPRTHTADWWKAREASNV